MNESPLDMIAFPAPRAPSRRTALALAAATLAVLAGCGGGAATTGVAASAITVRAMNGVGSGGTGRTSMSIGTVSFSSSLLTAMSAGGRPAAPTSGTAADAVIVNGVTYADAGAPVTDDEGSARTTADLRTGTTVVLVAGPVKVDSATATAIEITSDIVGPVDAPYDPGSATLQVLGQTVVVTADTALDGLPGGMAALGAGRVVEVSSFHDPATGRYVATRIDPADGAAHYKLRGVATDVDKRSHTFRIGTQAFDYAAVPAAHPAEGQAVAVDVQASPEADGTWAVSRFLTATVTVADGTTLGLAGIASPVDDATHFTLDGLPVDASRAAVLPAGAQVQDGARVETQGVVTGGVLVARRVMVEGGPAGRGASR